MINKAKQRQIGGLNNAPLSAREMAIRDKEHLNEKEPVKDELDKSKCGLELAGLKPCSFGKHNPNFNPHNIR